MPTLTRSLIKKPAASPLNEFPRMKLWTLKEFDKLYDMQILTERCELIEGVIVKKMGQHPPHRALLHAISRWLMGIFGTEYLMNQSPVDFPQDKKRVSRLEPDVILLKKPETEFSERNPLPADVRLLVEVADSSLQDDLERKARIYGQSDVVEYWVADVKARQIWVHRIPSAKGYEMIAIYSDTQEVSALAQPEAKIRVSEFFPVITVKDEQNENRP